MELYVGNDLQCCEVRLTHLTGGWSTQHLFKTKKRTTCPTFGTVSPVFGRKLEVDDRFVGYPKLGGSNFQLKCKGAACYRYPSSCKDGSEKGYVY